ncbi:MAG: ATP-dependent DNA helicase [Candidatus Accumulibacter sp.]|jgi:ATP-dependent DNA helicase DinG|nr:ATP-dependent DNA helicase [Accumulibacter sp.]
MLTLSDIFATGGSFSRCVPAYRLRPQQLEMAEHIAATIENNAVLVAEAGTGTGKTFAYLIPAMLSGGKIIVSTGTKNLQDQLFFKDIAAVREALASPAQVALLKGRANYVCHYHLNRMEEGGRFSSREEAANVARVARFAKTTRSGDKAECLDVPETSSVWDRVTSTRENCLGKECPYYKECFVLAARRAALTADLVVVNHHLFFADVMLRDEGVAELLPACNTVIFDEAHQLPDVARLFFGSNVSTARVTELTRDARAEGLVSARDCLDLPKLCDAAEKAAKDLRLTLPVEPARFSLRQLTERGGFSDALVRMTRELEALASLLETQAERSEGLENAWRRAQETGAAFARWREGAGADTVRWGETYTYALQLNATPLVVAETMQKQMSGNPRAWIFTSATLAVHKDFTHYCGEMGLLDAETALWDSPFDYARQSILYVPRNMPEPNTHDYTRAVADAAFPVVEASGGRAFFLCTTLRAMRRLHELLQERIERAQLDFPLFLQGETGRNELLEAFRRSGNAILVGSQSFWEGVDVRGEALSLVVIDKLPFAPPDDPVLAARIERMKQEGRNAFMEYQLPSAVINVKQGAGRLIRDETDRGVLMICDPRLVSKRYGRKIWQSLPPMKRTRELKDVVDFFTILPAH